MYLLAQIDQFGHCSSPDFHSNGIHFLEWWWISENLKVNLITCLLLKCIEKRRQKTYVIFSAIFNLFYYRYFIFHISIVAIVTHLMFCEDFSQFLKSRLMFLIPDILYQILRMKPFGVHWSQCTKLHFSIGWKSIRNELTFHLAQYAATI